ncbi:GNAT family N-acetyltransferase [Vibrio harveyi]|uniref:GNAT family N-acetyltransferase n=1 Tax=Vibrio harveyi TaxID=669 RepID=UPI0002C4962E|nr:GNAT family N-acetyltransferase [Vibrio harveyi]EMR34032.1 hypothetical protein MUQ_25770 [Vibrio harveyi CAIM 1792]
MIKELTTTFTQNDYEAAEKVINEYLVQTGFEGNIDVQTLKILGFLCKENILRDCKFHTYCAYMDGEFIGGFVLKEYDDALKINYMVVTENYQNQGLGTIMARQVRHIASMIDKPSFALVNRNEAADVAGFYNSVGYELVFDNVDGGGDSLFMCDEKSLSRIEDNQNAENAMVYPNTASNIKAAQLLAA